MTDYEKNDAWLPGMKPLLRQILASYRSRIGNSNMRFRVFMNGSVSPGFVGTPSFYTLNSQEDTWFKSARDLHESVVGNNRLRIVADEYAPILTGKTIYVTPLAPASPDPTPYDPLDLPDPHPVPPACIPCLPEILIA